MPLSSPTTSSVPHSTPDLWQKALLTIDPELRKKLGQSGVKNAGAVERVLGVAKEKRDLCRKGQWVFELKGKRLVVRDLMEKIVRWLDHFKSIGDIAAQYDTAHAALPWAAVRFILQVCFNDVYVYASTVEGLERISRVIARTAVFESVHLQRRTAVTPQLEPVLTELYSSVLLFLGKAKKFFEMRTAVRLVKSTLTVFQDGQDEHLLKIEGQEANLSALAAISDSELLNNLQLLEKPLHRMAQQVNFLAISLEYDRYSSVLQWLSSMNFRAHHKEYSRRRLEASGKWLFDNHEFKAWNASSSSSIFLLHGMTGTGKSTLASAMVDSVLDQNASSDRDALLAYFYCSKSASEMLRSEAVEVLRCLLRQLAVEDRSQHKLHAAVARQYDHREIQAKDDGLKDVTRLSVEECVELIVEIMETNPATIVVDAIDELTPSDQVELTKALQHIITRSRDVVKIFATSRDCFQISGLCFGATTVLIDAQSNSCDLKRVVESLVDAAIEDRTLLLGDVSGDLRTDLVGNLVASAGEMFQLAIWELKRFCDMPCEKDIRDAMQKISSSSLHDLYAQSLDTISKSGQHARHIAINTLTLLLCLRESLPWPAFCTALTHMSPGKNEAPTRLEVLRVCQNMVIHEPRTDVLRLAHSSIQDFLEHESEFSSGRNHQRLARSCLRTLLYEPPVAFDADAWPVDQYYHYASMYWASHYALSTKEEGHGEIFDLAKDFIFDENDINFAFKGWLDDMQVLDEFLPRYHDLKIPLPATMSKNHNPVFTICAFGLIDLLTHLGSTVEYNWDEPNIFGQTGLYLACIRGQSEAVKMMLAYGANPNIPGGEYGNALQAACFQRRTGIAKLLVEHGADPRLPGKYKNAFHASVHGGNDSITFFLLKKCFKINDQSQYDDCLLAASQCGRIKVIQRLQEDHEEFRSQPGISRSKSIRAAISKGHLRALIGLMAEYGEGEKLPSDSMVLAAYGGHEKIVEFLLNNGFDISLNEGSDNPIRAASLQGYSSIVRLLLDHGGDVSGKCALGNSLEAAAMSGHISVVDLLLEKGVDVDIFGGYYGTAMQAAAYRGHSEVVCRLLNAGGSVYTPGLSKTAVHAAIDGLQEGVVQLFFSRGYYRELSRQHDDYIRHSRGAYN